MLLNERAIRIAVIHTFIELNARKRNIERVSKAIERILQHDEHVKMIILPQMLNGIALYEGIVRKGVKVNGELIPGPTVEELININRKYAVTLLAGPILERRGSRLYRSAVFISNSEVKKVVRQVSVGGGVSGYNEIPYIDSVDLKVGVYIAEDIFYPDVALALSILNPNITVVFPHFVNDVAKQQLMAKARALESRSVTIIVGGIYTHRQDVLAVVPTVVISEEGDDIERVDKMDERVVVLDINVRSRDNSMIIAERRRFLRVLKKLLQ